MMAPSFYPRSSVDEPTNRTGLNIRVYCALLVLTTLGLAARVASKRLKRNHVMIDDYLILWAYVLAVAETGMLIYAIQHAGWGRHLASLHTSEVIAFGKVLLAGSLLQPCILASAKVSILILLRRIFITRGFQRVANTLIAVVVLWYLAITLAVVFICTPVKSHWDPEIPAHCGNQYLLDVIDPIPWIVTDFAVLLAPMPMIWKLQMATGQRVALGALFLIGGLTCIVSCIRYRHAFYSVRDPTWDVIDLGTWNIVEAHTTVLCTCLIASKPCFMALIPDKLIFSMSATGGRSFLPSLAVKGTHSPPAGAQSGGQYGSRSNLPTNRASYELQEGPTTWCSTSWRKDIPEVRQIV